jgi:hypothetical protein
MKKIMLSLVTILMTAGFAFADSHTWPGVIGIPNPGWGVETDVVALYGPGSGATYDYSDDETGPVAYRLNSKGEPYTHYIDPDDPGCTNTGNPHGTEATPRCTCPTGWEKLPVGSVFEFHGSPALGGQITGSGTLNAPIFYRGTSSDKPVHNHLGGFFISASYLIFENITFDWNEGTNKRFYFGAYDVPVTHIAIRDCEFYNGLAVPNQSYQCIRSKLDNDSEDLVQNIIIYNCSFHDIGEDRNTEVKNDAVAIAIDANTRYVWVIENDFYRIGGDGIQIAWDGYENSVYMPQYIYVGKNTAHDNYENFIDLKMCQDVIVSQNSVYDIGPEASSYSGPTSIPYRYGSGAGPEGAVRENIWTLFNVLYDFDGANGGFVSSRLSNEEPGEDVYYIGNIAYNGHNSSGGSITFLSDHHDSVYWLNNLAHNVDCGFHVTGDTDDSRPNEQFTIANNIVSKIHSGSRNEYMMCLKGTSSSFRRATVEDNIFYDQGDDTEYDVYLYPNGGGTPSINNYDSYSAFCTAYPSFCTNSMEDNPDHVDAANANFHLMSNSPSINAGAAHNAYATFQSRYGISIQVDFDNNTVPYGGGYDIGPHEYSRPSPPKDLRIIG